MDEIFLKLVDDILKKVKKKKMGGWVGGWVDGWMDGCTCSASSVLAVASTWACGVLRVDRHSVGFAL